MARIWDLPEEIISQIIDLLDAGPPSEAADLHLPDIQLLTRSEKPLKNLSLVSRQLHRIIFPRIFTHIHIPLTDLWTFNFTTKQWTSIRKIDLAKTVRKVLDVVNPIPSLLISTGFSDLDNNETFNTRSLNLALWSFVQDYINPSKLTILAPPLTLASLLSCPIHMSDAWAFTIPYQIVTLSKNDMPSPASSSSSSSSAPPAHTAPSPSSLHKTWLMGPATTIDIEGQPLLLFSWSTLTYTEGSSLNNYGSYHYFEKKPPTLFIRSSTNLLRLGTWLHHLSYNAIFPHYDSFYDVLSTVGKFHALRILQVSLVPGTESALLSDGGIGRGNTTLKDCWAEVERCYALLVEALGKVHGWEVGGCWEWSLMGLEEVRCADWATGHVKEDVRRLFDEKCPSWSEVGEAEDSAVGVWRNGGDRIEPSISRVA